jgi:hypothetical protein
MLTQSTDYQVREERMGWTKSSSLEIYANSLDRIMAMARPLYICLAF